MNDGGSWLNLCELTKLATKATLYAGDPFYRESAVQISRKFQRRAVHYLNHLAVMLIRPDAFILGKACKALDLIDKANFRVLAFIPLDVNRVMLREVWRYSYSHASLDRIILLERLFSLSNSVVVLLWGEEGDKGVPATVRLSLQKGAAVGSKRQKNSLRSCLGSPSRYLSLIHISDEPADIVRELGILLSWDIRDWFLNQISTHTGGEGCEGELRRLAHELEQSTTPLQKCCDTCSSHCCSTTENCFELVDRGHFDNLGSLEAIDAGLDKLDCNCPARPWISILAGCRSVGPYDVSAPPNPIEKFRFQ